jgi:DNA-binding protein H-NS
MPKKRLLKNSEDIQQQIKNLKKELKSAQKIEARILKENSKEIKLLSKEIKRLSKKHAMIPDDILKLLSNTTSVTRKYKKNKKTNTTPAVAKYQNPGDSEQTWTGKGRRPAWFIAAIESGINSESLEIPSP